MPGGNRMGPLGMGPMTGRRAGYCAGFDAPGYGYGMGWGRGGFVGGRGWRHRFFATGRPGWMAFEYGPPPTGEQELSGLKQEAEWLKGQLEAINRRIDELGEAS